ncbi:MAG: hypothetical protein KJ795_10690 [Gammaproteobacteria bacterium]|nr:hypothetical protein [Gammaproteobacteria bacterium]MBU1775811.1 hypothetical protein [Gammaproteobacteria bacterium]MBU1969241.1 hypothetical protein [Gammaproteobacteria bacterium]
MRGIKSLSVAALLATLSGTALAQEAAFELPLTSGAYVKDYESFKLAANDVQPTSVKKSDNVAPEVKKSDFEPPLFSGSNAHKYLGLATIVGAALTGLNHPPENECESASCPPPQPRETNGTHAKLARATVALAAATVVTGLVAHWDDFHLEDGITDPDNMHALLGTAGMLTMAYAVSKAADPYDSNGHAGKAIAGAALMAVAIKITW